MFATAKKPSLFITVLVLILIFSLVSCGQETENGYPDDDDHKIGEPRYGGVLKMAYGANPSTLDLHKGTDVASHDVACMTAEALYERCQDFLPHPDLAESCTASDDLLTHTVKLHEGFVFHDGPEMTADDVVASVYRWLAVLPSPPELADVFVSATATDKYTVEFRLNKPRGDFVYMIIGNPKIYPKRVIDKYGEDFIPNEEVIGTGPYRVKEFISDRHAHLVRFEDYKPRGEEIDGRAGRKNAYLDEIIFYIVPDASVRMMGVESGQYHYGFGVDFWEYVRLVDHPTAKPVVMTPYQLMRLHFNCANPPTNDVNIRRAIQAAIDPRPIMDAGFPPELYVLSSSKIWRAITEWHTEAGKEYYNQANPALARELLDEAGYRNETIMLIGMSEYEHLKNSALISAKQLEDAGFKVELRMVDQGTFVAMYLDDKSWNIAATIQGIVTVPTTFGWTRDEHIGWWQGETPRKKELGSLLRSETDPARRFEIWEELHELSYSEANEVMLGTYFSVSAASKNTFGWMNMPYARWWNVWIKD